MYLSFIQTPTFAADAKRLDLTDEDLQALERAIMDRPDAGPIMRGTGGLRKIRFAPPSWHTGKSGAARVCYIVFAEVKWCYLMTIFAKNEKSNLSNAEKSWLRQWVEQTKRRIAKD